MQSAPSYKNGAELDSDQTGTRRKAAKQVTIQTKPHNGTHNGTHNGHSSNTFLSNDRASHQPQEPQPVTPPVKRQVDMDSGALLHASRRIDWRFLLPNPALERVAYFGANNGSLLSSLALFADELTIVDAKRKATQHAQYDVVVAYEPTPQILRQAVDALQPGGSLYIEAHGLFWPAKWQRGMQNLPLLQQPRLWQPNDYVRTLQHWGLAEADAFWFWPNFEDCTKIVPLNEQAILAYTFAAQAQSTRLKARLKAAYKQWLVQRSWLSLSLPSFGIVAH